MSFLKNKSMNLACHLYLQITTKYLQFFNDQKKSPKMQNTHLNGIGTHKILHTSSIPHKRKKKQQHRKNESIL